MWSTIILCLCVSLAYATSNPAWRDSTEYDYEVQGRTLTSLHEITDQYSGVECKAILKVQTRSDGNLRATIVNPKCSKIHMPLSDGWKSHIPESELAWEPLSLSTEPFEIRMENGAIKGVVVNKKISNWEANMIKGIVSQLQLKTNERPVASEKTFSSFKVMEDTVTGSTETFYKIVKMPDHMIQHEFNGQRLLQEKRDEHVYEVTKHKNYTHSVELPSYYSGFSGLEGLPATNQMGTFLTRGSFSRAVLAGKLNRYTIQNSMTVSEILVSPTIEDKQKGSVYSMVNITLKASGPQKEKILDVSDPIYLDNLVYSYGKPFDQSKQVRRKNPQTLEKFRMDPLERNLIIKRLRRSLEENELLPGSEESYKQEDPTLEEAPESPLLRFTEGYHGQSIKLKINIVQKVKQLAMEISEESKDISSLKRGTLNKFTILTSLIRIMNADEIQNAANELYNNARKREGDDSWKVFHDAVAESGTGPALVTIWKWIKSGRIEGVETSLLLATMTRAVRQPTVEYMKTYFDIIKDPKILSKWPENDTAILSFSGLIRQVYVYRSKSASQYPVKSFRNFRNEEGMAFLNKTIVPYFAEQLHRAISQAETHKIHLYIRALGNIGVPEILSVFEPYLEGEKQASQFQRLLMVLAMDRLATEYPKQARSVLVRLYLNSAETEEVRLASVYQIMRTNPPVEMLQTMATTTNYDEHEHVNAAVKSVIESLSKLEGPEFHEIRLSAKAAKPLLTKKEYGVQYGGYYLHQHVVDELRLKYKENLQVFGSEDHYYPKGIRGSLYFKTAGLTKKFMHVQAIVSSVNDLTLVLKQLTSGFAKKQEEQSQKYQQQLQHQWSSQKIAEILKMKRDVREQLEGNLLLGDDFAETMLSFDNKTVHKLIKELTKFETEIKNGKHIRVLKMYNDDEMAVAFPTEMGLPFLYTYDTPAMIRIEGRVKGTASPRIAQDKLESPELIEVDADMNMMMSSKIQGRISFITPYDHQQYVSGYNKVSYVNIPLKARFEIDIKKMQMRAEFEKGSSQKPTTLFHTATIPFLSRLDILNVETASIISNRNTHVIQHKKVVQVDKKFGAKETGLPVHVMIEQEKPLLDIPRVRDIYNKEGAVPALLALWRNNDIQKSEITVKSIPEESSTYKTVINLGYYSNDKDKRNEEQQEEIELRPNEYISPEERQRNAVSVVTKGMQHSKGEVIDLSVEFQGERKILYTLTGALASENDHTKSRYMLKYEKQTDRQDEEPYVFVMKADNAVELEVAFGALSQRLSKIRSQIKFERSEEREQFLKEQPLYKQCQSEMRQGNNYLPACANITYARNRFDRIQARIQYENIPMKLKEALKTLYYAAQFEYLPSTELDWEKGLRKENEMVLQGKFDPDLRSVNISIRTEQRELTFKNIPFSHLAEKALVLHPAYDTRESLMTQIFRETYRPFCVVDKTKVSTFNNRTYPAEISDKWTVMFQVIPKTPRFEGDNQSMEEQLKYQPENYAVLVKRRSENERDVKITVSSPETKFEVIEMTMTHRQHQGSNDVRAKISINGNHVQVDDDTSYDYEHGFIKVFKLPTGEVRLEIRDKFDILYDGERIKLSVFARKYRDSIRGICGQFNYHKTEEFLTPNNCFVQDFYKFIKSYEVEGSRGEQVRQQLRSGRNMECNRKTGPHYVDAVTSLNKRSWTEGGSDQCNAFQTKYIQQNGEVCFTIRPMPVCVRGCRPTATIEKNVPVHCVQKSGVTQLWKNQIEDGSSPDFSDKSETRRVSIQSPVNCA